MPAHAHLQPFRLGGLPWLAGAPSLARDRRPFGLRRTTIRSRSRRACRGTNCAPVLENGGRHGIGVAGHGRPDRLCDAWGKNGKGRPPGEALDYPRWRHCSMAILTALLVYGLAMMPNLLARAPESSLKIDVTGEQWWWRVRYRTAERHRCCPGQEIRLPLGEMGEFQLESSEVKSASMVMNMATSPPNRAPTHRAAASGQAQRFSPLSREPDPLQHEPSLFARRAAQRFHGANQRGLERGGPS
jgi:hypothetical protein